MSVPRLLFGGAWLLGVGLVLAAGWIERGTARERDRRLHAREEQRRAEDRFLAAWEGAARGGPVTHDVGRGTLNAVAVSPDGRVVASVSSNDRLRLHDPRTGEVLEEWRGHRRGITRVAWSPDGTRLASAGPDRTVRVWTLDPPTEQHVLTGHESPVASLAFTADGTRLVAATLHAQVKVWGVERGEEITSREGPRAGVLSVTVSPHADAILWAAPGGLLRVWDAATGDKRAGLRELAVGRVSSLRTDPGLRWLATAARDEAGNLRWFDVATERPHALAAAEGKVTAVAFSADGDLVASATEEGLVQLWDAESGHELVRLPGDAGGIEDLAFDAPRGLLVAAGPGSTLQLWHAATDGEAAP